MASIGEKLVSARELKKLTRKEVAKETNIPPRYIEALEEEDFDKLPSETYVIGFLRSYAEYLKIDAEEIIQAYKGFKIGESATPLEELTKPTRSPMLVNLTSYFNKYRNYFYIGAIAVGFLLVIMLFSSIFSSRVDDGGEDGMAGIKNKTGDKKAYMGNYHKLVLRNDVGYAIVSTNEGVFFTVDQRDAMFILREIKNREAAVIEISPGNVVETIGKDAPKTVNIKGCPREVEFTLKAVAENSANIKVRLGKQLEGVEAPDATDAEKKVETQTQSTSVIARDEKNLNIVMDAQFLQKSFIEVYLDGMLKRRGMVPQGISERWEATSHIQVKLGNAGGVKVKVNNKEYNWGGPGQVVNKMITWKKDPDNPNKYDIMVNDWR